jgi:micrococcal nuclease
MLTYGAPVPGSPGRSRINTLVFMLTLLLATACAGAQSASHAGPSRSEKGGNLLGPFEVVKVVDGDTVTLQMGERQEDIRLVGIDTPEKYAGRKLDADARKSGRSKEALQALGREASKVTSAILAGRPVWLELDVQERDRYGRLLGYLYVASPDGDWQFDAKTYQQVNLEIVRRGWADVMTYPPNVRYEPKFREAARRAKETRQGIWAQAPIVTAGEGCEPQGKNCPAECPVKGNINRKGRKLFHLPGGEYYSRTIPEACFPSVKDAVAAGFSAPRGN